MSVPPDGWAMERADNVNVEPFSEDDGDGVSSYDGPTLVSDDAALASPSQREDEDANQPDVEDTGDPDGDDDSLSSSSTISSYYRDNVYDSNAQSSDPGSLAQGLEYSESNAATDLPSILAQISSSSDNSNTSRKTIMLSDSSVPVTILTTGLQSRQRRRRNPLETHLYALRSANDYLMYVSWAWDASFGDPNPYKDASTWIMEDLSGYPGYLGTDSYNSDSEPEESSPIFI